MYILHVLPELTDTTKSITLPVCLAVGLFGFVLTCVVIYYKRRQFLKKKQLAHLQSRLSSGPTVNDYFQVDPIHRLVSISSSRQFAHFYLKVAWHYLDWLILVNTISRIYLKVGVSLKIETFEFVWKSESFFYIPSTCISGQVNSWNCFGQSCLSYLVVKHYCQNELSPQDCVEPL